MVKLSWAGGQVKSCAPDGSETARTLSPNLLSPNLCGHVDNSWLANRGSCATHNEALHFLRPGMMRDAPVRP
jgi:hypothetical protein